MSTVSDKFRQDIRTQRPWGVVSAWKAGLTKQQNNVRNACLLADILTMDNGYYKSSVVEQDGWWNGEREESYLIWGIPEDKLIQLGNKYDQEAVLHSNNVQDVAILEERQGANCSVAWLYKGDGSVEAVVWYANPVIPSGSGVNRAW